MIATCDVVGDTCERPPTVQAAPSIQQFADNLAIADDKDRTGLSLKGHETAIQFGPFGKSHPNIRCIVGGLIVDKQHLQ